MPKKLEPRPVIRSNTDVKKAKSGWDEDGKPKAVWHKVTEATGLYLVCDPPSTRNPSGLKRWMHRYRRPTNGRWNEISIGHVSKGVDLDKARLAWMDNQFHLRNGRDPQEVRQISRGQTVTFAQCAEKFIEAHGPGKSESWFRNTKLKLFVHAAKLANRAATVSPNKVEEAIAPSWPSTRLKHGWLSPSGKNYSISREPNNSALGITWRNGRASITNFSRSHK